MLTDHPNPRSVTACPPNLQPYHFPTWLQAGRACDVTVSGSAVCSPRWAGRRWKAVTLLGVCFLGSRLRLSVESSSTSASLRFSSFLVEPSTEGNAPAVWGGWEGHYRVRLQFIGRPILIVFFAIFQYLILMIQTSQTDSSIPPPDSHRPRSIAHQRSPNHPTPRSRTTRSPPNL